MKLILPQRIATLVSRLKSTTSRLQRIAASIAFIDQALFQNVIPTFAKVKGNFLNDKDRKKTEIRILKTHRENHRKTLKYISSEQYELKKKTKTFSNKSISPFKALISVKIKHFEIIFGLADVSFKYLKITFRKIFLKASSSQKLEKTRF